MGKKIDGSSFFCPRFSCFLLVVSAVFASLAPVKCLAGGGPENVLVVVNARSWASKTIANHYCKLRHVPLGNVVEIDWEGSHTAIDVETFRQKLLTPIVAEIDRRQLAPQIDYIVYSADFPYRVDFKPDLVEGEKVDPTAQRFPSGSLTGMTYLGALVMTKKPSLYSGLRANWYMRATGEEGATPASRAFRSRTMLDPQGEPVAENGLRYMASTMLAYTSGRGNSVAEALDYLSRSVAADGARPKGTIYFVQNGDIRSKTRQGVFAKMVEELKTLGVAAEIVEGTLPKDKADVAGAVIGAAGFDWKSSGSSILPGAICEHLTSFGGILEANSGQTPLTEFLRHGAAGSSGTITEPFALQPKFPHPAMHVHYARGASLGEAFYQAVQGPYQLLIVGDPLCQPWAVPPKVILDGLKANDALKDNIKLTGTGHDAAEKPVARLALYVGGRLAAEPKPSAEFEFAAAMLPDGQHELRLVGMADSEVETQGRIIVPFSVARRGRKISAELRADTKVTAGNPVTIAAESPDSTEMVVLHGQRLVGKIAGPKGDLTLDPLQFGLGPVRLLVVGISTDPEKGNVVSTPLDFEVTPGEPLAGLELAADTKLEAGFRLLLANGTAAAVTNLTGDSLVKAGAKPDEPFSLTGIFETAEGALYQLQVETAGELEILVNGKSKLKQLAESRRYYFIPLPLAAGKHSLELKFTMKESPRIAVNLGLRGAPPLDGTRIKHQVEGQ